MSLYDCYVRFASYVIFIKVNKHIFECLRILYFEWIILAEIRLVDIALSNCSDLCEITEWTHDRRVGNVCLTVYKFIIFPLRPLVKFANHLRKQHMSLLSSRRIWHTKHSTFDIVHLLIFYALYEIISLYAAFDTKSSLVLL